MKSQNYGWICVAPVIGGNTFNLLFGRVYDSNTVSGLDPNNSTTPPGSSVSTHWLGPFRCDPLTHGQVGKIGSPHAGLEAGADLLRRVLKRGVVSLPDDGSHDCE